MSRSFFAYRQAVARSAGSRERSAGFDRDQAATVWLRASPAERRELLTEVTTTAELDRWLAARREVRLGR